MKRHLCILMTTAACLLPAVPASAANLVAQWRLDEGQGQLVLDATKHGINGVLGTSSTPDVRDPAWTTGLFGGALRFGAGDQVSLPDDARLEPPTVSVLAWVRREGSPGQWRYIVSKGGADCFASSYGLYTGHGGTGLLHSRPVRFVRALSRGRNRGVGRAVASRRGNLRRRSCPRLRRRSRDRGGRTDERSDSLRAREPGRLHWRVQGFVRTRLRRRRHRRGRDLGWCAERCADRAERGTSSHGDAASDRRPAPAGVDAHRAARCCAGLPLDCCQPFNAASSAPYAAHNRAARVGGSHHDQSVGSRDQSAGPCA